MITTEIDIQDQLTQTQSRIQCAFDLACTDSTVSDNTLREAMAYAMNGGKCLRAACVYSMGQALGATAQQLDIPALSCELIHAYSLVHDDLPAMDNDDWRRGQPSCHKQFGEAMAILTGDALQTLAFQLLSEQPEAQIACWHIQTLSRAAGAAGMASGQAMDLNPDTVLNTESQLTRLHHHKTGALLAASCTLGAISAHANALTRQHAYQVGLNLGLLLQIQDDILDTQGDRTQLGKTPGKDAEQNKLTYVQLLGLPKAIEAREALLQTIHQQIDNTFPNSNFITLANYIANRRY